MDDRIAFENKMEALLNEWKPKAGVLQEKIPVIKPEKRPAYNAQIEILEKKYSEALQRLSELKAAPEWRQAKDRLEKTWKELSHAYTEALRQFEGVHD